MATERGIATQLVDDGHVPEEAENQKASAKYLQEKISAALDGTIQKGKELMAYFQDTATILADRCPQAINHLLTRHGVDAGDEAVVVGCAVGVPLADQPEHAPFRVEGAVEDPAGLRQSPAGVDGRKSQTPPPHESATVEVAQFENG